MYTHTHVHTWFSFLDGLSSPSRLVAKAKELGMTSLAITDHGYLGGVYDFKNACDEVGIKPLLGCELYYTPDLKTLNLDSKDRTELAINNAKEAGVEIPAKINGKKPTKKQIEELIAPYEYPTKLFHILFIAKNQNGWTNLVKLQSEASELNAYKKKPCCDLNLIRKYSKDLICTTACIGSYPAWLINHNKVNEAINHIKELKAIFEDDLYLEVQPLSNVEQVNVNTIYMTLSKDLNISLVSANDVHYTNEDEHDIHDTLLCMSTGKLKTDENRMKYTNDFWLRTEEEMIEAYNKQINSLVDDNISSWYKDAITTAMNNTNLLANKVDSNIKIGSDVDLFPVVDVPNNFTTEQYLTMIAFKGLYKYLKKHPNKLAIKSKYEERLHYELRIINKKGYAPYMLAVREYIKWCKDNDIPVGPGRGSAAGSLCLLCIDITQNVDPIEYNLLFSRFLTEDRTSPPDYTVA